MYSITENVNEILWIVIFIYPITVCGNSRKLFDKVYSDKMSETYYSPNKTAYFIRFDFFAEVEKFMEGRFNEEEYSFDNSDFFDEGKDSPMKTFKKMMRKGDD